jgi:hypothetical protein
MGQGNLSLIQQIHNVLPCPCDHHLEAYFITACLHLGGSYLISNVEILACEALEHFKEFDDPDLKCMLSDVLV